eukprot:SAG22_NODE_230_length_14595_cov_50.767660_16_plen_52_part_00
MCLATVMAGKSRRVHGEGQETVIMDEFCGQITMSELMEDVDKYVSRLNGTI